MAFCKTVNKFCYMCGKNTVNKYKRNITKELEDAYEYYFSKQVTKNVWWAPNIMCIPCCNGLNKWVAGKQKSVSFGVPMIWDNPIQHNAAECYFCTHYAEGLTTKMLKNMEYKSTPYAQITQPHSDEVPIPHRPDTRSNFNSSGEHDGQEFHTDPAHTASYAPSTVDHEVGFPHLISQARFNDLVRDMYLPKSLGELLGSRLRQWNLMEPGVKITLQRSRQEEIQQYFLENETKTSGYCANINGLMYSLNIAYVPENWRLFIDSSKTSLKAVLLHNGNVHPSIPVFYSKHTKETFDSMEMILNTIKYSDHNWMICSDLKVVALLQGLQPGYTKYCCFLCEWDSRCREKHYIQAEWPRRTFGPGEMNVLTHPLVPASKIILPPLHIKLGLVKNFVKALNKDGKAMVYLKRFFPKLSEAKVKEGMLQFMTLCIYLDFVYLHF